MQFTLGKYDVSIKKAYQPWSHNRLHRFENGYHWVFGKISVMIEDWTDEVYRICRECNSPEIAERRVGDESYTICADCQSIEQGYKHLNKREFDKLTA